MGRSFKVARAGMSIAAMVLIAAAAGLSPALAQKAEPTRELGAHEHGRGHFSLAVEKGKVSIDLEAAAADIVGFEYAPKSKAETEAVEAAKTRLAQPLSLFGIPEAAGCKVTEAAVELEKAEEDDHGKDGHKHEPAGGHAEFHGHYALECARPEALTSLNFAYFEAFPRARALEVVAVSEKTQIKAEATRASPRVALPGLH